ncbi:MAG: hypothetical protein ACT4P8_17145 [Betaproteobacteria bacterium]
MKTPASSGTPAGTVKFVSGEVKAVALDGSMRILQAGDRVFMGEVVTTTANAVAQIHLENGRLFDLQADAALVVDDITGGAGEVSRPVVTPVLEDIIQAEGDAGPGLDFGQLASAQSAERSSSESPGSDHATVIVEQANTSVRLVAAAPGDASQASASAMPGHDSSLQADASFLVRDSSLLQYPGGVAHVQGAVQAGGSDDNDKSPQTMAALDTSSQPAESVAAAPAPDMLAAGEVLQQQADDPAIHLGLT